MGATRAIRRIGGAVVVAAALAGAAAGPAAAMTSPACSTRLAAADVGTSASCWFDTIYDWATITVVPSGTVTAAVRCVTSYGYTYSTTRTVSKTSSWTSYSPGSCSLTLTSGAPLTTASGSATPTTGPIYPTPY